MSKPTSIHCEGFHQESLDELLQRHASAFSSKPGSCDMVKMVINILPDSEIVSQKPYPIPQSLKSIQSLSHLIAPGLVQLYPW